MISQEFCLPKNLDHPSSFYKCNMRLELFVLVFYEFFAQVFYEKLILDYLQTFFQDNSHKDENRVKFLQCFLLLQTSYFFLYHGYSRLHDCLSVTLIAFVGQVCAASSILLYFAPCSLITLDFGFTFTFLSI